jgi:hypothetical protein
MIYRMVRNSCPSCPRRSVFHVSCSFYTTHSGTRFHHKTGITPEKLRRKRGFTLYWVWRQWQKDAGKNRHEMGLLGADSAVRLHVSCNSVKCRWERNNHEIHEAHERRERGRARFFCGILPVLAGNQFLFRFEGHYLCSGFVVQQNSCKCFSRNGLRGARGFFGPPRCGPKRNHSSSCFRSSVCTWVSFCRLSARAAASPNGRATRVVGRPRRPASCGCNTRG